MLRILLSSALLFIVHVPVFAQSDKDLMQVIPEKDKTDALAKTDLFLPAIVSADIRPLLDRSVGVKRKAKPVFTAAELTAVKHDGFTSYMHRAYNLPAWVSYSMNKEHLEHPGKFSRADNYPKDPAYPVLKSDLYRGSGYDHGHLAPARDFKHVEAQYVESNTMTNMSPQHGCFNQKGWCMLETLCREWTLEHAKTTTYIVTGPVLNPLSAGSLFLDTLCIHDSMKVFVPAYFFKAICFYDAVADTALTIGFVVPNRDVDNPEVRSMAVSIDQLEAITGINFFPALNDRSEQSTEQRLPDMNYNYSSECGTKPCSSIYKNRDTPDLRIRLRCRPE
ncbi:MAG: DNA/RNA non-specific endonuclease [Bacteroidota bacterium]